jgi:hypothetical protein
VSEIAVGSNTHGQPPSITKQATAKEANHGRNRHHLSVPDTGPAFRVSAAVTDAGRVADP